MLKPIFFDFFLVNPKKVVLLQRKTSKGALAQLARALAWHARGHRFDSVMLHRKSPLLSGDFFMVDHISHIGSLFHLSTSIQPLDRHGRRDL